jgi:uncharacterized protein
MGGLAKLSLLVVAALLTGCAGDYVARTRDVRRAYEAERYPDALHQLEAQARAGHDRDRLLVLMDRGMLLHAAGQFAQSSAALSEAERLADRLEGISLSEEAATLIGNERERAYRGEDFERLMINVLQALNYAQLDQGEEALVEVRRVNERLRKMVVEEKKPYQQLAVARYLGGVLYEDQKEWDSAFIDYYKAYELNPELGHLGGALLRLARRTQRVDQYQQLRQRFPEVDDAPLNSGEGEVVVVIEAGLSPQKESTRRGQRGELVVVPIYRDRGALGRATVEVGAARQSAVPITSIAQVARVHLEDRIGRMLAKNLAATAVKAGIAAGAGSVTNSREVGLLAFYLLTLANEADLRSWLSLPAELQLARVRLPAGEHEVAVTFRGRTTLHPVEIRPGGIAVLSVRRY